MKTRTMLSTLYGGLEEEGLLSTSPEATKYDPASDVVEEGPPEHVLPPPASSGDCGASFTPIHPPTHLGADTSTGSELEELYQGDTQRMLQRIQEQFCYGGLSPNNRYHKDLDDLRRATLLLKTKNQQESSLSLGTLQRPPKSLHVAKVSNVHGEFPIEMISWEKEGRSTPPTASGTSKRSNKSILSMYFDSQEKESAHVEQEEGNINDTMMFELDL